MTQIVINGNWVNELECYATIKREGVDFYFLPITVK